MGIATTTSARHKARRFPFLVIASWAALYLPRLFLLGLYIDDWWSLIEPQHATAPFSLDRLHYFVGFSTNYGPRPLLGFIAFLASSIAGPSPVAFQLISALLVLAAALSLRAWLNRLMGVFPGYREIAGDIAVISWMSLPWTVGTTAWPMVAHNLASQILFTEVARLLLARERMTPGLAAILAGGITASGLIYEAFYLAIFPIVGLYAISGRGPTRTRRQFGILLGVCLLAQALPVAFNRYVAYVHPAGSKMFRHRWPKFWMGNILSLPDTLLGALHEYALPAVALLLAALVCAAILWSRGRRSESHRPLCVYLACLVAAGVTGLLLTVGVYSAAGYGFQPVGANSRTLLAPSLWCTLVFFALICCLFVPGPRAAKAVLLASVSAGLVLLVFAQSHRVAEWAFAWREEQRILQDAPVSEISRLPSDAAILYIGPTHYRGVAIFGAPWDLTAAVHWQPLHQNRRPYENLTRIYPAVGRTPWTWDGATLVQTRQKGGQKYVVRRLYVWREGVPGLEQAQPGFRWEPPATDGNQN